MSDSNLVAATSKLDFSSIRHKLYGRTTELSTLRGAYRRVSGCLSSNLDSDGKCLKENKAEVDSSTPAVNERKSLVQSRHCSHQSPSEMVLVSGHSGTGKSYLVDKLNEECCSSTCCCWNSGGHYFVSGKFDQLQRNKQPYSAVSEALGSMCDILFCNIENNEENEWTEIGQAVVKELGLEELKKLRPIIPKLRHIIQSANHTKQEEEEGLIESNDEMTATAFTSSSIREAQDSFLFTLREFIKLISSKCCILTWFLDDLQWADSDSLSLIKSLLADEQTKNLLFVGSYREEEVCLDGEYSKLHVEAMVNNCHFRDCVHAIEQKGHVRVSKIKLGNLDETSINSLISDLLQRDKDDTLSLTKSVQSKTQGNVFFVLQFLEALQDEKLLWISMQTFQWTWADDDVIHSVMSISNNVAEFMVKKIKRMPRELRAVLMVASSLGFQFDVGILRFIFESWQQSLGEEDSETNSVVESVLKIPKKTDVEVLLGKAVEEGILDKVNGAGQRVVYTFSHDRIQQASYSLLPSGQELEMLHLKIGQLLLKRLSCMDDREKDDSKWLLFIITFQFNHVSKDSIHRSKKIELAQLNCQVAKISAATSAFAPSSKYLSHSIDFMEGLNPWTDHYKFMLELCIFSAQMEMSAGNTDRCIALIDTVSKNAESLEDKIPVYVIHMEVMASNGLEIDKAINLGFRILAMLGEKFPKKVTRFKIMKELYKTRTMLQNITDGELIALPFMTNKYKTQSVEILSFLFACGVFKQAKYIPLVVFRLIQLSIKYGLCSISPVAIGLYGVFLCSQLKDIENGVRFGNIALSILERGNKKRQSTTNFMVHTFIKHWHKHIHSSLDPLLNSYEAGMRSGEVLGATLCATAYCEKYVGTGMPLCPLERDMRQYHQLMVEYKQTLPMNLLLPTWQFVLNLIGQSDDPLILSGEAMDESSFLENAQKSGNVILIERTLMYQLQLAYTFDDLTLGVSFFKAFNTLSKSPLHGSLYVRFKCFHGLIALAMARKTRKRKWTRHALRAIKQVKQWVEANAGNVLHLYHLMNAEHDSRYKNEQLVKESFDLAIAIASRNGFINDQALANERAGIFFLERRNKSQASFYLSRACGLYHDWGAQAKVNCMNGKYASLLRLSEQSEKLLCFRGRSRFVDASKSHRQLNLADI